MNFTSPSFLKRGFFAKKIGRLVIEITGSLAGLSIFALLILLARLALGPINLDYITPDVEAAFQAPQVGIKASIDHTQLVWRKWYRPFEIELVNVTIQKDQNPQWLKVDHIGIGLKLPHLLTGTISLKHLRLYRPHLLLEKDENGEFSLGFGEKVPTQEFSFKDIAPLLALGNATSDLGKLNELSKISIIDADILLKDEQEKLSWDFPKATLVLKRYAKGFQVDVALRPLKGSGSLKIGLAHTIGSPRLDAYINLHQISFNSLIEKYKLSLSPSYQDSFGLDDIANFLQKMKIPLNGKIHLAINPTTFQVLDGSGHIDLGQGKLNMSLKEEDPFPLDSGNIAFTLSPQAIELTNLSLISDTAALTCSSTLTSPTPLLLTDVLAAGKTFDLKGEIKSLPLKQLGMLWPEYVAPLARKWLTQNMKAGLLTHLDFSLKGRSGEEGFQIDDLKGTLQGENAEITYLEDLPPAQHVKATGIFNQKGFDIQVLSGDIENLPLQEGHILISGLDGANETLTLAVKTKGSLSRFLTVLDHKPLEYAKKAGLDPQKIKGEGNLTLNLSFPLLAALQLKDVKMTAKGDLKNVAFERNMTDDLKAQLIQGNFTLDLTQDQLEIKGPGILNQLPSTLTYTHFLQDSTTDELQIKVETHASFEDFQRLGFDYVEYGKGPTQTNLVYTLGRNKKSHLLINLDTTASTLSFAPLKWKKNPGERSNISFVLLFDDGHLSKMTQLKVAAHPYTLQGEVLFDQHKTWQTIYLSEFKGPHTQTQVTLHSPQADTYVVYFKGQSVDIEKYLEYLNEDETQKERHPTRIKVLADVGQLRLGEGKTFQNVKAVSHLLIHGKETTWESVKLRARAGEGTAYKGDMASVSGGILFDINPGPQGTKTLEIRANDAGMLLKNLNIYNDIRGGYITVKAQKQGEGPYKGVFKLKNFNANQVPLLGRFAALLSPMGIANLFSHEQTLSMDRFDCTFDFSEDLIRIKDGVGKSISLGFTVEGQINRKDRLFNLKGNIIPARFINSILSNIPIIGSLLNGGKGEGLFAIAYSITGNFDTPNISLNPLSALAPGFIRKIFQSLGEEEPQ